MLRDILTFIKDALHGNSFDFSTAGFMGAVSGALFTKNWGLLAILRNVFVGYETSYYLTESATKYVSLNHDGLAYLIGACGMVICQGVIMGVEKAMATWMPKIPGGSNG